MKVGAVISNDGKTIVPLVNGPVIRVRDTVTGTESETENPAIRATQGRRIVALQELLKQGVEVVVAPPNTFCEHSYAVAKTKDLRFLNLPEEASWDEIMAGDLPALEDITRDIPQGVLFSHHHHS